jgi:hypothetical protein
MKLNEYDLALDCYQRIVKLEPNKHSKILYYIGLCFLSKKDLKSAYLNLI